MSKDERRCRLGERSLSLLSVPETVGEDLTLSTPPSGRESCSGFDRLRNLPVESIVVDCQVGIDIDSELRRDSSDMSIWSSSRLCWVAFCSRFPEYRLRLSALNAVARPDVGTAADMSGIALTEFSVGRMSPMEALEVGEIASASVIELDECRELYDSTLEAGVRAGPDLPV